MNGQATLDVWDTRAIRSSGLVIGAYVTAAPMPGAPSVRLMVLWFDRGNVAHAAPHAGGAEVAVCLRGACEVSTSKANGCARKTGAWHPVGAEPAPGLF